MSEPGSSGEKPFPLFSLAERDRRWRRVRELMAEHGIDILLAPPNNNEMVGSVSSANADARYLTQFGMNGETAACVFPLEGRVIGFAGPSVKLAAGWLEDARTPGRGMSDAIVDALREAAADGKTIGIAGLTQGKLAWVRAPEGVVNHTMIDKLQRAFPRARIVSATDVLGEARLVKSEEEIVFLERGMRLAEAALQALLDTARPGVKESTCYAAMVAAEIERDGTVPFALTLQSGPVGHLRPDDLAGPPLHQPTPRLLQRGDLIRTRIEGRWGGYTAQMDQSVFVGPVPEECRDAWAVAIDSFERSLEAMKPGVTFGEVFEVCGSARSIGGWTARLTLHGRGLGDDGPLIAGGSFPPEIVHWPLEPGHAFVLKPAVVKDGRAENARFGDSVVVTQTGARRLGIRSLDFASYDVAAR